MSGIGNRFRKRYARLARQAGASEVRRSMLEALLAEMDDQRVRDFILGNERPEFEVEVERWLWKLGFKDAFCRTSDGGQAVEITFNFDAQPELPRSHLRSYITGVARELRPEKSCGTILYTRRDTRLIARFRFEPRRVELEQFRRYRERQA